MLAPHAQRLDLDEPDPFYTGPRPFKPTWKARQLARIVHRDEPDGVWRCHYCRIPVRRTDLHPSEHDSRLPWPEREHVVPESRGGTSDLANLVLACQPCNWLKADLLLDEMPDGWENWRSDYRLVVLVQEVRRGQK